MESEKTILDNVAETAGQAGDAAMAAAEAVSEDALDVLNAAEAEADATADALWQNADAAAEMAAEAVDAANETVTDGGVATKKAKSASVKSPKRKSKNLARGNAIAGLLFVLPFIIGFIIFLVYPLSMSVRMSLNKVSATSNGLSFVPVGFWKPGSNFYKIFRDEKDFIEAFVNELKRMLLFVPGILVFSFFMATLLNQEFKGRTVVRAIYFLPVILASGVFLGLDANNPLINNVKEVMRAENSFSNITNTLEDILLTGETGNKFFQYVIDIVGQVYDIAMASGIQIIVFLSGLQTIPPSMYEAAKMEGCTGWESFWKITWPLIKAMVLVNIVYTLIDFFTRTDSALMKLINDTLLIRFEYGKVAAMSWAYFIVIAAVLGVAALFFSRGVYYND